MLGFGKNQSGKDVFDIVKGYFDIKGYPYKADDENLILASSFGGDDMPIGMIINVNDKAKLLSFSARLMFEVPETAKAVMLDEFNNLNANINIGCFCLVEQSPVFRMVHFYGGAKVTKDLVETLLGISLQITDMHDGMLKGKLPEEWKASDAHDSIMYG